MGLWEDHDTYVVSLGGKELTFKPDVIPYVMPSGSDVRPTANMTTTTARRLPKMSLPAIPSPKAQPESNFMHTYAEELNTHSHTNNHLCIEP